MMTLISERRQSNTRCLISPPLLLPRRQRRGLVPQGPVIRELSRCRSITGISSRISDPDGGSWIKRGKELGVLPNAQIN